MDGSGSSHVTRWPPEWVARRRFDAREYHRLAEIGLLHEDDRIELMDGELIRMAPIGGPHMGVVINLIQLFAARLGDRARISPQNPVRLDDHNEPEPDLALLRPRADRYLGGDPALAADVLLLVEVADSSLRYDRDVKLPLYARHGIPEVWIVDLAAGAVEVNRQPSASGYAASDIVGRHGAVAPLAYPDARLDVDDFLPPARD